MSADAGDDGSGPSGVSTGSTPEGTAGSTASTPSSTGEPGTSSSSGTSMATTASTDSGADFGEASDSNPTCYAECGNGVICGIEDCDCGGRVCTPEGLGFAECFGQTQFLPTGELRYYTGGIIDCNPASCQFDFVDCTYCGDEALNGLETCEQHLPQPSCQELGLGPSVEPLPCDVTCQLDTSSC